MEMILNSIDYAQDRPENGYSSGGELCFAVNDGFFPSGDWYDCAYLDLKNWLPKLISFGSNHTDSCEFSFMDGPYTVRLFRREDGAVFAHFLQEHTVVLKKNAELHRLLKSALSACRKYDRFLYENSKMNAFQEEIKTLKNYWILKTQEKYHV